jgi:hypothetical protein
MIILIDTEFNNSWFLKNLSKLEKEGNFLMPYLTVKYWMLFPNMKLTKT